MLNNNSLPLTVIPPSITYLFMQQSKVWLGYFTTVTYANNAIIVEFCGDKIYRYHNFGYIVFLFGSINQNAVSSKKEKS